MSSLRLSAQAATQEIVAAGLFPIVLTLLHLSFIAAYFDADGCCSISCSEAGYITAAVMIAQSNLAALSVIAHTFAHHGINIASASLFVVEDSKTGRYVHDDKVHLLVYKGAAAAALARLLKPFSGMKAKQLQLLADKWHGLSRMSKGDRQQWAADCRALNQGANLAENLTTAVLRDEQVRHFIP